MMSKALYGLMFLIIMALQTGAVASLPEPYRLFPLALVVGVIILHERSLVIGAIWMLAAGSVIEIRGLGDGSALAGLAAAITGTVLALSVFTKRSFWALLGIGTLTLMAYVISRWLWLVVLVIFTDRQFDFANSGLHGLTVVFLGVIGVVVFGAYIRRFLGWLRDKFVSKGQPYDISLP